MFFKENSRLFLFLSVKNNKLKKNKKFTCFSFMFSPGTRPSLVLGATDDDEVDVVVVEFGC